MKNGSFMEESKKEIYNLSPQQYDPKTESVPENSALENILQKIEIAQIKFPFIAKPDIGFRGLAIQKINTITDLVSYNAKANFDYLVQDLIPFENEIGVFYVRFPNQEKRIIIGIVSREFLNFEGNGSSTLPELIQSNP